MRLAAALLMLLTLAPAARAETVIVGSGGVRAQVETDSWSLKFVDRGGREVVAESRAMPIGYRTATGWSGATGAASVVRDGDALIAEVGTATTTPLGAIAGQPVRVRIAPGARGTITVEVTPVAPGPARRSASASQRGRRSVSTASASGPSGLTIAARVASRPSLPTGRTTRMPSGR